MANQKFMKRVAPVVLSTAVAMSSMPTGVFASDFSDSEIIVADSEIQESAEFEDATDLELEVTGEEDIEITSEDVEIDMEEDADIEAEDFASEVDMFSSGEQVTDIELFSEVTSGTYVYGTANIPYADFFYGEMNDVQENAVIDLTASDPVTTAGYRDEGMYDAITCCTTSKSKRYDTSYYTETETSVTLEGIKNVNVAVPTTLYEAAVKAIEDGESCSNQLLNIVKSLQNVSDTAPASGEYKVLNGDGTLTAMKTETKVLDIASSITADSVWGNYQVSIEFGESTDKPTTANMMGVIFETSDGVKYGMEHSQNLWVQTGEIAFAVREGFVEPHKNTIEYKRHESLEGKTITKITYLVKDSADIVINTNLMCKYLLADGQGITGASNVLFADGAQVQMTRNVPDGSAYKLKSVIFNENVLIEGTDYTYDNSTDVLTVRKTENTGVGTYTMQYEDASYEDLETSVVLESGLQAEDVSFKNGKLVVNSDVYTVADYIAAATSVSVDGTALSAGRKATTKDITDQVFKADGSVNFDAVVNKASVFTKEDSEEYSISMTAAGFPDVAGSISKYIYVYAGMTWDQYWAAEGVYNGGSTASSTEKDRKGETDLGAFDAVTRATTNHGLHRGSFQAIAVIEGNLGSYSVSHWEGKNTVVFTDGTKATYNKGTLTFESGTTDEMNDYKVTGIKYVPVKVSVADYEAFCEKYTVVENDGTLSGGYGEVNLNAYSVTAKVTAGTNGLKTAVKNEDGSFSFGARAQGTDSGIKDTALKQVSDVTATVKPGNGSYGEFLRVDLTGNYGDLGSAMQAVKWTYYGNDSSYNTPLQSYGTKFAADNWMHKSMGIQLGLTESQRFQLPDGYDGTGYWTLTVYALGYEDYTIQFQANEENIARPAGNADSTPLVNIINEAKNLKKDDYTPESWAACEESIQNELEECEEMLENIAQQTQYGVEEQIGHLREALDGLVKAQFSLSSTSGTVKINKTVTVKVNTNLTGAVKWTSSNSSVASVNNGTITAKAPGTAKITASLNGKSAVYTVTVPQPVKLSKSTATIYVKGKPASVTLKTTSDISGTVKYTTSNNKVATVSSKGVVTAKKAGTVTITATVGKYKATCKVTVKNPSITVKAAAKTIYVGKTTTVKVTKNGVTGTAKYSSSNKKIATVNSKGVVTAKKAGTVKITVKVGSYKKTVSIKVKAVSLKLAKSSATIKKGKTYTIKATATPTGKITYKSSNKKVATVTSNGVVKGLKKGTAKITVTCNGTTKTFKVTVK